MGDGPDSGDPVTGADPVSAAQRRAVVAYVSHLLAPDVAQAAAQDAIAAFTQTLGGQAEPGTSDSRSADDTLLALTRLMTAVSLPDRSSPEDRRQAVWASIGSTSHCTCREAAALIATRANDNITLQERAALDEHLANCGECRELAAQSVAADRAFQAALGAGTGRLGLSALPGGRRAGAALLAVVVALGAGAVVLSTGAGAGGSGHARAAPSQTQTAEVVALTVPAASKTAAVTAASKTAAVPTGPVVGHRTASARRRHGVTRATPPRSTTTPTGTPRTRTVAAPGASTAPASEAPAPSTVAVPGPAVPASGTSGAEAPSSASPAPGTSSPDAPSTAAQVSGASSLPADSAPQQGISGQTSTTP